VERIIEVPVITAVERLVEVPVDRVVHVPVERFIEDVTEVEVLVERFIEKRVEVPADHEVERVITVPVERLVERIVRVEVPVERIIEIERVVHVPVPRIVQRIVEVPYSDDIFGLDEPPSVVFGHPMGAGSGDSSSGDDDQNPEKGAPLLHPGAGLQVLESIDFDGEAFEPFERMTADSDLEP